MENNDKRSSGTVGPDNRSKTNGPNSENWPDVPENRGVEETPEPNEASRLRQMQHGDESDARPVQERGSAEDAAVGQRGLHENAEGSDYE